jgi:cyclopropane-fatty-acyl-phospholipid synthase
MLGVELAEAGLVPDLLARAGIRRLLRERLDEIQQRDCERAAAAGRALRARLASGPIALVPDLANQQHYEVPPAFFEQVLGRRLKYSCALWPDGVADLDAAEERMLELTCLRAGIRDGMSVLDLGCGWGSLSLWIAEHYPACRVLSVSNSKSQREFILRRCGQQGLDNVEVVTADVNVFAPERRFDRVLSVEMFEHVRNHALLLSRISTWLEAKGKLFVHHFAHRECMYTYEAARPGDWMAHHFFSGGVMPSDDMLLHLQRDLVVEQTWRVGGLHYRKTAEAWLALQDARREGVTRALAEAYGSDRAGRWFQRWRLFFLACSELFGYRGGNEWWVTHALMSRREGGW